MRKEQLDNWLKEGGKLPMELTNEETFYLNSHGAFDRSYRTRAGGYTIGWELNGEKHGTFLMELIKDFDCFHSIVNFHKGKSHGEVKRWRQGVLFEHKKYAYGVLLKDFLKKPLDIQKN